MNPPDVPPPPAPPAPRMYETLYGLPTHLDAAPEGYGSQQFYQPWRVPIGAVPTPTPAALLSSLNDSHRMGTKSCFLALVPAPDPTANPEGLIKCFTGLRTFSPQLGHPATDWDNKSYAFISDVFPNSSQAQSVEISSYHLSVTPNTRVLQNAAMLQHFNGAPDQQMFGPFEPDDGATFLARSRRIVYAPCTMYHLFKDPQSPRSAYIQAHTWLTTNNLLTEYEPLLHHLLTACTRAGVDLPSVLMCEPFTVPLADDVLFKHRQDVLLYDLPALSQSAESQATSSVAAAVAALGTQQRDYRNDDANRRLTAEGNKPLAFWGPTNLQFLTALCHGNLAPIWEALATTPRGQQRPCLQSHCDTGGNTVFGPHTRLIISPKTARAVIGLDFDALDEHDLTQGCAQPFALAEQFTPAAQARAAQNAQAYDIVNQGGAAPVLGDIRELLAPDPDNAILPTSLEQARHMIQLTLILLYVLLGSDHDVVRNTERFHRQWLAHAHDLIHYVPVSPGYRLLGPALFVRYYQLELQYWISRQWRSVDIVPSPQFDDMFACIKRQSAWEPRFPPAYLSPMVPVPAPERAPRQRQPAANPQGDRVPPLVPGRPPAPAQHPLPNLMVRNDSYKGNLFQTYADRPVRVRQVLDANPNTPPPRSPMDPSVNMCVAFHVKGMCNTRCGRAADHHPHTDAQDAPLVTWCGECYPQA